MSMNQSEVRFIDEYGYLIKKELIDKNDISEMIEVVERYCIHYKPSFFSGLKWHETLFQERLITLRNTESTITSKIYDAIQANSILHSILSRKKIISLVSELLNTRKTNLTCSGAMLRMDYPFDRRNRLDWHLEQSYYTFNGAGREGMVIWIPLVDVSEKNGTIVIKEGSHLGNIDYKELGPSIQVGTLGVSEQFSTPDSLLDKFKTVTLELSAGDCALFYMNTLHASGHNISDSVRIVIGVRYHNSFSPSYRIVKLIPTETKYDN